MSLKNPVTQPGIDPGTVRLVAQRLNHYATPGPHKRLFGRTKCRWKDHVAKVLTTYGGCESDLENGKYNAFVNTMMNVGSHKESGNLFRSGVVMNG